jgi:hypothetical protein
MSRPIVLEEFVRMARAATLGWYDSACIASRTRVRVASEMRVLPAATRDTVPVETPAAAATSFIVEILPLKLSSASCPFPGRISRFAAPAQAVCKCVVQSFAQIYGRNTAENQKIALT